MCLPPGPRHIPQAASLSLTSVDAELLRPLLLQSPTALWLLLPEVWLMSIALLQGQIYHRTSEVEANLTGHGKGHSTSSQPSGLHVPSPLLTSMPRANPSHGGRDRARRVRIRGKCVPFLTKQHSCFWASSVLLGATWEGPLEGQAWHPCQWGTGDTSLPSSEMGTATRKAHSMGRQARWHFKNHHFPLLKSAPIQANAEIKYWGKISTTIPPCHEWAIPFSLASVHQIFTGVPPNIPLDFWPPPSHQPWGGRSRVGDDWNLQWVYLRLGPQFPHSDRAASICCAVSGPLWKPTSGPGRALTSLNTPPVI